MGIVYSVGTVGFCIGYSLIKKEEQCCCKCEAVKVMEVNYAICRGAKYSEKDD